MPMNAGRGTLIFQACFFTLGNKSRNSQDELLTERIRFVLVPFFLFYRTDIENKKQELRIMVGYDIFYFCSGTWMQRRVIV